MLAMINIQLSRSGMIASLRSQGQAFFNWQ